MNCPSYGGISGWVQDVVMVGAVLTQNTAWTNVEKAITNLKQADCLTIDVILASPDAELAQLIRPSGYFKYFGFG